MKIKRFSERDDLCNHSSILGYLSLDSVQKLKEFETIFPADFKTHLRLSSQVSETEFALTFFFLKCCITLYASYTFKISSLLLLLLPTVVLPYLL